MSSTSTISTSRKEYYHRGLTITEHSGVLTAEWRNPYIDSSVPVKPEPEES